MGFRDRVLIKIMHNSLSICFTYFSEFFRYEYLMKTLNVALEIDV